MRARRMLAVWTGVVAVCGLFVAGGWSQNEANCNEATSFICLDEGAVWLITAVFAAGVWVLGLFAIGVVALVRWFSRTLSDRP